MQRYVDVPNSSSGLAFKTITSQNQTLTYGQVYEIATPDGYTTNNLSKLNLPNGEFVGAGLENIKTKLPVKITYDHLEYTTLYVYYLNAKSTVLNFGL